MRRRYFNTRIINNKIIIYTSSDNLIVVPTSYDFGSAVITNTMSNNVGKITFVGSVTKIGNAAFANCHNLASVTIPDSVTTIRNDAFVNCYSLTSVTIPDSVTSIGYNAFYFCDKLESVTIGDSVTMIGDYAFSECDSLKSVYCRATTPPVLDGTRVFDHNGSGYKIYVPMESVEAYKSAENWSEYAGVIVGYDFDDGESSGGDGQGWGYELHLTPEWENMFHVETANIMGDFSEIYNLLVKMCKTLGYIDDIGWWVLNIIPEECNFTIDGQRLSHIEMDPSDETYLYVYFGDSHCYGLIRAGFISVDRDI